MSDFLKKNWGYIILALFVGFLIYTLFHKPPPITSYDKDKKTIDSLVKELDKVDKQRKKDSITWVIIEDIYRAKNDSFGVVTKTLKDQKSGLIKEINEMINEPDSSLEECEITKKKIIGQRDSAISIADKYEKVTEDIVKGNDQMIIALTSQNHKLDSTLSWAIQVNKLTAGKYDTLYKDYNLNAKRLKVARTEVKIGAGIIIIAIGIILGQKFGK